LPHSEDRKPDVPSRSLIGPQVIRQVTSVSMIQAEIMSLTRQLDRGIHAGRKTDSEVEKLMARRTTLSQKLRRELSGASFSDSFRPEMVHESNLQRLADEISHLVPWCHTISVPVMAEGINQTPGTPGTLGEIATAGLFSGGLGFGGTPEDDGVQAPNTEKWWIHNWNCQVEFPSASADGALSYRFTVDNNTNVYFAPANSGSVMTFVTLGTTSDTNQTISNWSTVGWPTNIVLPQNFLATGGSVPVSGTISLKKGKKAAIGLIFGVIVSVASGYCQLMPTSNFGTRLTLSQGQQVGPSDYGKIEYCVNPHWWFEAIQARLRLEP
jgi:hypothetical protein